MDAKTIARQLAQRGQKVLARSLVAADEAKARPRGRKRSFGTQTKQGKKVKGLIEQAIKELDDLERHGDGDIDFDEDSLESARDHLFEAQGEVLSL